MMSLDVDYVTFYRRIVRFGRPVARQLDFIKNTFDPQRVLKNGRVLQMIVEVRLG